MYFTQDDYKKIQQWLSKNSVKDTEFNEANIPFNGNEIVSIVQGNQNKRVFLKDLVSQIFNLGVSDFVNITDKYDAPNISLEEAIRLIPSRARKEGQVITFLDMEDHWHIYQFKGVLNQWNVLDQWKDLFEINIEDFIIDSILPDEEDLTKSLPDTNGNSYLSLKDREYNPKDFSGLGRVILRKNIMETEDPIYGKVKKNVLYQDMFTQSNTIYEIRYDFDLNGEEITIPESCVLDFQGGSLNNGTIVGNNTTVFSSLQKIFHNINIEGSWIQSEIHSVWFDFISDEEVDNISNFRNMMKMAESKFFSNVYIENGVFYTSSFTTNEKNEYVGNTGIAVPSNVYIHNEAIIKELPNPYEKTTIFHLLNVENVVIEGGKLVGNINNHTGTSGEWGHGIYPVGARNVVIKNIEIRDFWGDGIDIQSPYEDFENKSSEHCCRNILIDNVKCLNNRRQGISIEAVDGLIIRNSEFGDTGHTLYTPPGAGLDIEPWHQWQTIHNIVIDNCKFYNNKASGLLIHLKSSNIHDNDIKITNCYLGDGLWIKNAKNIYVDNCNCRKHLALWETLEDIVIQNVKIYGEIYCRGSINNLLVENCNIEASSSSWSGFEICFENIEGCLYNNIIFRKNIINAKNKSRVIHSSDLSALIHFYDNEIEGESTQYFNIGYGDFIGNKLVLNASSLNFIHNNTGSTIKVHHNNIVLKKYADIPLKFSDTTITNDSINFDYELLNNNFMFIGGFWKVINHSGASVASLLYNNFNTDVIGFIPKNWEYKESFNSISPFKHSRVNYPITNAKTGECYCIKIPLIRGRLRIYTALYPISIKETYACETIIDVNPELDKFEIGSCFNKVLKLNDSSLEILPLFAIDKDEENLYVYINSKRAEAKRFVIDAEFLSCVKTSTDIDVNVVSIPSLNFSINVMSKCSTTNLNFADYINRYNGFSVFLNNKIVTYNEGKWYDAIGTEV